jgi:hypothetical protein
MGDAATEYQGDAGAIADWKTLFAKITTVNSTKKVKYVNGAGTSSWTYEYNWAKKFATYKEAGALYVILAHKSYVKKRGKSCFSAAAGWKYSQLREEATRILQPEVTYTVSRNGPGELIVGTSEKYKLTVDYDPNTMRIEKLTYFNSLVRDPTTVTSTFTYHVSNSTPKTKPRC